jgi:hypothetical protein
LLPSERRRGRDGEINFALPFLLLLAGGRWLQMEVISPHSERPNSENVKNALILHLPLSGSLNAPLGKMAQIQGRGPTAPRCSTDRLHPGTNIQRNATPLDGDPQYGRGRFVSRGATCSRSCACLPPLSLLGGIPCNRGRRKSGINRRLRQAIRHVPRTKCK